MKKFILPLSLITSLIIFLPSVLAPVSNSTITCVDANNLQTSYFFVINGMQGNYSDNFTCPFGCATNICNPNPLTQDILIIGFVFGFLFLIFVLFILSRRI